MIDHSSAFLLSSTVVAVVVLIALIAVAKLNPFIALLATSLGLGIVVGMPMATIVHSFEAGLGGTLGHIAIVVGLGTMLGKMMAESGGADRIALTLIRLFGEKRVPWAMVTIGFLVGLPVFFEVAFVLLIPIAYTVAKRTNTSFIRVGLPMLTGISVAHGLMPPHPAAMLAVTAYNADVGRTIFYGLIVGIPTAILAGPVWSKIIAPYIHLPAVNPLAEQFTEREERQNMPGFWVIFATLMLPVSLMLVGSWADVLTQPLTTPNKFLHLLGNADIALGLGVLVSFVTLGTMRGFSRDQILKFSNECLAPTASITLLVGAGGGFGRILQDSGVSGAIVSYSLHAHIPILLLAWLVAAMIRVATGSATVAMSTAAGIVAPIAVHTPGVRPELLALATGAGSLFFSHVNDGGFWLVKEYFNMSVPDTFKSWTMVENIISLSALTFVLVLSFV